MSPTVKPGFKTVGLLPSERVSFADAKNELEKNGGSHVAEVLEEQEKHLKGVDVPHNIDTALDAANVSRVDMAVKKARDDDRVEEANVIAEAFGDAIATHHQEAAESAQDIPTETESSVQVPEDNASPRVLRRSKLSISASDNPFAANLGEREPPRRHDLDANLKVAKRRASMVEETKHNRTNAIERQGAGHVRFSDTTRVKSMSRLTLRPHK
jgi:hypothetical protein